MSVMRLLVVSDIHANHAALRAVLADARDRRFDRVVCLGDALGYGPHPQEVLEALRGVRAECVLGNHDQWALLLQRGHRPTRPGGAVERALAWQLSQTSRDLLHWVGTWPERTDDTLAGVTTRYRHGSPTSIGEYVNSTTSARQAFTQWDGTLCFVGHTHHPAVYATLNAPNGNWTQHHPLTRGGVFTLPPGTRAIMNPGSVGQPRDGDPRASYGLYDVRARTFEVIRVPYDVQRTQRDIRRAGLPDVLAARLTVGT